MTTNPTANLAAVSLAVAAASIWGVSFIIPVLLPDRTALEITVARYLAFGLISGFSLLRGRRSGQPALSLGQWREALVLALTGYLAPYLLLVSSIQDIGVAVPTLIMGTSPVTVAIYGNWRRREFSFSRLLPPLAAIFTGLVAVNLGRHGLAGTAGGWRFAWGLAESLASLASLTWFLVANLLFLRDNPRIGPLHWASAVGAVLGLVSLLLVPVTGLSAPPPGPREFLPYLLLAGIVLGMGSSWLGGVLWNKACNLLPAALAGQLIVFWPISGLVLAYLVEQRLPSAVEAAGVVLTMAGVLAGIWRTGRSHAQASR